MIRHTVLISFEGADDSVVNEVVEELRSLPAKVPSIAQYTVGIDLRLQNGPPTVVVIADFDTVDDYLAYSADPEHLRVVNDHIRPHMSALSRAQIELD